MTALVLMYVKDWCPYCHRARALLTRKGVEYTEIDIEQHPEQRVEMIQRSGRRTVPQIFIGDVHVGGSDDLHALQAAGELDDILHNPRAD